MNQDIPSDNISDNISNKKKKNKSVYDLIEIHVINLKRSTDRKILFEKNNSEYLKKYMYFEAVDGNDLDINKLPNNIYDKRSTGYTKGALGCALSHYKLWEKCSNNNKPFLILEDDVIFNKDFIEHFRNVFKMLPENWDILQLSYNFDSLLSFNNTIYEQCNSIFNKTNMTQTDINNFINSDIYPTIAKLKYCFGTSAYIISPKGAKNLIEKCFPLNNRIINNIPFLNNLKCFTIDCMMNSVYKDINAYVCPIPFIITPHISENYKSTIQ
jgi:GR25 family glycosyltransferase involved in LPS biosynthesis